VGIRLVQQLLLRQGIPGPILVMTYKNHALDEFLMGLLPFVPKQDLVRMGNMSQAVFRILVIVSFCAQFWGSRILIRLSEVRIRILLSSSKKSKKNLAFYCFVQCCGSGSRIRCLFDPWIRDPG
jgi:hypothetical protein